MTGTSARTMSAWPTRAPTRTGCTVTRTATECYEHEMTENDHERLLLALGSTKATFQLSGYHSELYDDLAETFRWRCVEFDLPNNASGKKQKDRKTECLWMNYYRPVPRFFGRTGYGGPIAYEEVTEDEAAKGPIKVHPQEDSDD